MIELNENFEPVIERKTISEVNGQEALEQWLKLNATARLENVLSEYSNADAPQKIQLELRRLALDSNFIGEVEQISVSRTSQTGNQGYRVVVDYVGNDRFSFSVSDT